MKYDNTEITSTIIKELLEDERPREKLLKKGPEYLTDIELLAILIRTGTKNKSAIDVSRGILRNSCNGLRSLVDLKKEELCEFDGIGESKAALLIAAIELGKRISKKLPQRISITNPWDVHDYYGDEMKYLKKEEFRCIMLDTKNQIISETIVSIGTLNSSLVHPREVFRDAIKVSACRVILVHNHPSGDTSPSKQDIMTTERLEECGKLIGIEVIDHIIIGDGKYFSFKENELL